MKYLTRKERELLSRCADLVLAGEWPWGDDPEVDLQEVEWEKITLVSANAKLKER